MTEAQTIPPLASRACARCGAPMTDGQLACPVCGWLVHVARLHQLSDQALQLEPTNPAAAVETWRQCLSLVPPGSPQHQMLLARIAMLTGAPRALDYEQAPPRSDPLPVAVLKTGGSMLLSIAVYAVMFFHDMRHWPLAIAMAVGFALLILVHEMGHVLAMRRYKMAGSPPVFIPFVGALINLRRNPRNAWEEAVIGIGGPLLGTAGALACYAIYWLSPHHNPILLTLSFWGFLLNLFNLLPIPPLDGGRVTAAVSPWIWMLGVLGLVGLMLLDFANSGFRLAGVNPILLLVLLYAFPRVWRTLRYGDRNNPYFQIGRKKSWTMGAIYVALGAVLITMFLVTGSHAMFV